ncbi:hypothetical protein BGW36DRAFT_289718 [Talaromyces proteolyticus]|uniref:WSC domain-containing protein n=1 Tax=Talaromyces proteolyticus TaxID=1131652 RepID=A0AAD4KX14_9EURO|nr:uncharacterized protein BGW36DRAFT_289718 [Talaromyces proteolyticus]KAH8701881.1 hypothetical protein BGW36DRAFT_289718 [Talaromyces proteolyticus]
MAVITVVSILGTQVNADPGPITKVDCYSQVPNFKNNGTFQWQSNGHCQGVCVDMGSPVMALTGGNTCLCGDELPPNATKTSGCDLTCNGYPPDGCGGKSAYEVFLTGMTSSVPIMDQSSATTAASTSSTTTGVSVITQAGQTIVVTASSAANSSSAPQSSGVNTAGIAAGVVVGVVALSAIIGAAFFFMRRRRAKQLEEEYRRNAEINAFAQKKPNTPSSDSRWDGDYMAQRRQSNGSIDDDQDFSRRILQVRYLCFATILEWLN